MGTTNEDEAISAVPAALVLLALLAAAAACRQKPPLTMTCQFDFHAGKGACSFINESNLDGEGCVRVEVMEAGAAEPADRTTLCAPRVPPRQNVTRPLSLADAVVDRCRPAPAGKKAAAAPPPRCALRLTAVKR